MYNVNHLKKIITKQVRLFVIVHLHTTILIDEKLRFSNTKKMFVFIKTALFVNKF